MHKMSDLEYEGYWWLPETPDKKVFGQLEISPRDGITLNLYGTLNGSLHSSEDFTPLLVLGRSTSGKAITLYDCLWTGTTSNVPGFDTTTLLADKAFIGVHFQSQEEARFKRLFAHYANLDEWVNRSGFTVEHSQLESGELTIHYELPEPIKVKVGSLEITIVISPPSGFSVKPLKQVTLIQKAWMQFSFEQDAPLDDYLEFIHHIQNFLSLAMTRPTYPLAVQGITDANKQVLGSGKEFHAPVEVFYRWIPWQVGDGVLSRHEMLFALPQVQNRLETVLGNWIAKTDVLRPVYDLYFSTLYSPQQFLESIFLSLAQAMETYHRRRFGGEYQMDAEYHSGLYEKFVEAIPQELAPDFKDHLKTGTLRYANQFSLRTRLRKIAERLSSNFPIQFIAAEDPRRNFVNKVVDTRNYLTHFDPDLQNKAAEGEELYDLTQKLKTLLEICLLEELGLSLDEIRMMTSKNRRYWYVFQLR
jgi:hypothetical protein